MRITHRYGCGSTTYYSGMGTDTTTAGSDAGYWKEVV